MDKQKELYQCQAVATCAYIYDAERGDRRGKIPKGTAFADLPDDWRCPACGASKEKFKRMGDSGSSTS